MIRVLVAPDKFKGTLSASEAIEVLCTALAQGNARREVPGVGATSVEATGVPMADGGDGTLEIALSTGYQEQQVQAVDARGRQVMASYAIRSSTALIELAAVCGLRTVLDLPLRPWLASTLGLGMVARHAAESGASEIVIGLGGSASVDGGLGFAMGLGVRVRDRLGLKVPPGLLGVRRAVRVDDRGMSEVVRSARWSFLVDVANPLLGPLGAAATFGPQKGLAEGEIAVADASLMAWAELLDPRDGLSRAAEPGMGAAGGVGFAGAILLGAELVDGAAWVAQACGLAERIAASDVVVTGEGRFDQQSLMGKGPGLVINLARQQGKPVYVIAGSCDLSPQQVRDAGVAGVVSLAELADDPEEPMQAPIQWLARGAQVLRDRMLGLQ